MPIPALDRAMDAPWAMLESDIQNLLSIADYGGDRAPEALAAYRENRKIGERASVRDNVALLHAQGPMFKGANLFTDISGATSYEILRRDLQAALDSPSIDAIMLCLDTPGGEAMGCDELAQAIYAARGIKPIEAYVSGFAASAGYWLASAAEKITVSDLSSVGSIGVVMGVANKKDAKEGGTVEFVSSQSPHKRPDPQTDKGRAEIQKFVDAMGDVFVSAVAKHRNVNVETVLEKFGGGGMEVGANAVALGMADAVGQFEAALSALSLRAKKGRSSKGKKMSTEANTDVATAVADALRAERARTAAIAAHPAAKTHLSLAAALSATDLTADVAKLVLDAAAIDTKTASDAAVETAVAAEAAKHTKQAPLTQAQRFTQTQRDAGALGLQPEKIGTSQADAAAGWTKHFN